MSKDIIQVLVVDDHELVRKSVMTMLSREPDIEVVGTAVNGYEAIQYAQTLSPDIIIMDVSMPELDGIRAAGEIRSRDISSQIIMLSMHHSYALVQEARKNGACGYIIKQDANKELVSAIRAASAGTLTL